MCSTASMQCDAAVPVKEHLQALLRLAWCKGGHNTASSLPLALVNQRQIFITPEDAATPVWFISTQLHAEGVKHMCADCECSFDRLRQSRKSAVTMIATNAGLVSHKLMFATQRMNDVCYPKMSLQLEHGLHTFHQSL